MQGRNASQVGALGKEEAGSRTRKREKTDCAAVTVQVYASLMGNSKAEMALLGCPESGSGRWAFVFPW